MMYSYIRFDTQYAVWISCRANVAPKSNLIQLGNDLIQLSNEKKKDVHSLWRRANARNVSFSISVRWSIYIINSVDKPKFRV